MSPPLPPDDTELRGVVEELFQRPPTSHAELAQRFAGLAAAPLREQLVERLWHGLADQAEGALIVAALGVLGLGQAADSVKLLLQDLQRPLRSRAVALTVLLAHSPTALEASLQALAPEQALSLTEVWLGDVLSALQADPGQAEVVAQALMVMPVALRPELLSRIHQVREQEGTSAAACFASALARPELAALHPSMLTAVIDEASREGFELLERLHQGTKQPAQAQQLQHALIRLRTRRLTPARFPSRVSGRAFVGSCDGQGAFIVLACLEQPSGRTSLVDICLRTTAGVRDGSVSPRQTAQDLERRLAELREGTGICFVEVSLPLAAALVLEVVARSAQQPAPLAEQVKPALAWFERLADSRATLPQLAPAARASLLELRLILERPEYRRSWFLTQEDLEALKTEERDAQLTAELQQRLVQMCEHMARWHHWRDEPELAARLAAAGREISSRLEGASLVQVLRERTSRLAAASDSRRPSTAEQRRVRQQLKATFFQEIRHPKGRDLARLDFAQLVYFQLLQACQGLPASQRPQANELLLAAYELGATFADFLLAGARWPLEQAIGRMTNALLAHCRLSEEESHALVALLLPAMGRFIEQVCASCPVACLDHPLAGVADVFFGTRDPGGGS